MNRLFSELVDEYTPEPNPAICNGLAMSVMDRVEKYIDTVFRSVAKNFPAGLTYEGCERCTPQEEFEECTKTYNGKRTYNIATSYLYLMKYHFKYQGKEIPSRYMYLPYVGDGGIIYLNGTCYHISPVITDVVISPTFNSIFVRLLCDKLVFNRCYHSIVVNGVKNTTHVSWSTIYRKSKTTGKDIATTAANTCNMHYLLAKMGFTEVFRRYLGYVPIVGLDEINSKNYPPDQWVICESTKIQPKTFIHGIYIPNQLKMAIPKEHWNADAKTLVTGFYYVADHFPDRVKMGFLDKPVLWKILLGHIRFSGDYSEASLMESIQIHFNSIDDYVDLIVKDKLKEAGYEVNDFYDLLALIMLQFDNWAINAPESNNSMYGKTMEILYYILFNVTSVIFHTSFKLNEMALKKTLLMKDIIMLFNKNLKTGAIYKLTDAHIAMSTVAYCGDNKYPKITSTLALQQSSPGAKKGSKHHVKIDSSKRLHISAVEAGSLLYLNKSDPTPIVKANMFLNVNLLNYQIEPKEKFKEMRDTIEKLMKPAVLEISVDEETS